MHLLSGRSLVIVAVLLTACSSGGSSPRVDGAAGSPGSGGSGGAAADAARDQAGTGGAGGSGGSGSGGSGSGGQAGGGTGGQDAAIDRSLESAPETPRDVMTPDSSGDAPGDRVDGGNCMDRGYDCPGAQVCMPCKTTTGVTYICVSPGIAC